MTNTFLLHDNDWMNYGHFKTRNKALHVQRDTGQGHRSVSNFGPRIRQTRKSQRVPCNQHDFRFVYTPRVGNDFLQRRQFLDQIRG